MYRQPGCMQRQYDAWMEQLTPTQWIARCARRLGARWKTAAESDLEEAAIAVWESPGLRDLAPEEAARTWLRPIEGEPPQSS